jgi:hypothetical protein
MEFFLIGSMVREAIVAAFEEGPIKALFHGETEENNKKHSSFDLPTTAIQ